MRSLSLSIFLLCLTMTFQVPCIDAAAQRGLLFGSIKSSSSSSSGTLTLDLGDNVKEDLCKDIFVRHSNASCILYDDEKCDGSEGIRKLSAGESFVNGTTALGFDVESISIKDGCQIKIFSGIALNGTSAGTISTKGKDRHVTFDALKFFGSFDDNVNSAICTCKRTVLWFQKGMM